MADDNNARYRSTDPSNRGPDQTGAASDPLAELARLIGRSEPVPSRAAPSRDTSFHSEPGYNYGSRLPPQQPYGNPTPPYNPEPAQHYAPDPAPPYNPEPAPRYAPEPAPHYTPEPAPNYVPEPAPQYNPQAYNPAPAPRFGEGRTPPRYNDDPRADWPGSPADPFALLTPGHAPQPQAPQPGRLPFDTRDFPDPRYRPEGEQAAYEHGYAAEQGRQPIYPQEPDRGAMPSPHGDEFYDDAPRGNRRKGLLTVAAVLGLAVLGTAAAFGYRSMFSGSHSSATPPVIRASGEPSKVAPPPTQAADASANKFNYDRFGDRGKDEQVVAREEKPVDTAALARTTVPRTVLGGGPIMAPPSTGAPSALGEPKRVRTVQIRPDQAEPSTTPQSVAAPAPQNPLAPPAAMNGQAAPPVAARGAAASRATRVARAPQAAPAPAPVENAPLSLSPEPAAANFPPPPAPAAPAPPPQRAAPPMRTASAPASGGAGGFLVQVSSQRSEADAESAYRNIQSKYTSVLGSQPHTVKRADLGAKGVYYRAMVGPFGSRDQAIQLCSSLKAAGGACVVQAN